MTEAGAAAPKADPESLVLRAGPGRVTRFRRGAIIAIAAAGSAALVAVAWLALKPASFSLVAAGDDRPQSGATAPPDALAGAPRSYGEVPQLGPSLPGDLGRPILEQQRQAGTAPAGESAVDAAQRAAQAAEAERQRNLAAQLSARESGVMMQLAGSSRATVMPAAGEPAAAAVPPSPAGDASRLALDPGSDPNNQQRRLDFVERRDAGGDVNPHIVSPAPSPHMLSAGSIIAASLITGLNSDLPGLVTAQVTENAYDSVTGRILLVPQGSRLIGSYDSVVAFGQSRALVVWQRIVFPDGSSIRIDNLPATDLAGYAGLSGRIDRHSWQLLKGVALSTLLGVGTQLGLGGNESDLVRAIRESAQQGGARAGDQLVTRNLNVQPSLRVRPGWPLRVVVHRDLVLRPYSGR